MKKAEPKKKTVFVDETPQPGPSAINLISDDAIRDSDSDTKNIDPQSFVSFVTDGNQNRSEIVFL